MLFLMMLYLVTATGFTLNLHYCFDRISSVRLDAPAKACASLETKKMKCCHDKRIEVEVKDSHQTGTKSSLSKIFDEELLFILTGNENFGTPTQPIAVIPFRGPPVISSIQPIYLINNTLRI